MSRSLKEWQEEIAAEMLKDFAKESGIPEEDIFSDSWADTPVEEEETKSEELDLDTEYYGDIDTYLDEYVDDYDVADEEDSYGDEAL